MTMNILQSTQETLRENLSSMFDNKKVIWPEPEQSTGEGVKEISGLRCWLPVGPAFEVMEALSPFIFELLNKHKDTLKHGEPKPRAFSFDMWMLGPAPGSANPTPVFSSKSRRQCTFAKALLKDSKLLDGYPGMRIKTWDKIPAVHRAGPQDTDTAFDDDSDNGIYMVDDSRGALRCTHRHWRLQTSNHRWHCID